MILFSQKERKILGNSSAICLTEHSEGVVALPARFEHRYNLQNLASAVLLQQLSMKARWESPYAVALKKKSVSPFTFSLKYAIIMRVGRYAVVICARCRFSVEQTVYCYNDKRGNGVSCCVLAVRGFFFGT